MAAVATSAADGWNQPVEPKTVTKMQNSAAITECAVTPAAFEKIGSDERSKSACKPSCRPMAVHPPAAAIIGKPAFEQAGRASVMVPPGERGVIVLRCSGIVLVAPLRVGAASGRGPLSTSALVGAVKSTAAAASMVIRRSACGLCAGQAVGPTPTQRRARKFGM